MGSIAIVIDDEFMPYYDACSAVFTGLVASAAPALVRNKALESFSMICEAVGKEKCGVDAAAVLNELVRALVRLRISTIAIPAHTPNSPTLPTSAQRQTFDKDDNDTYRFICFAIVRIATTLGADFAPYLQVSGGDSWRAVTRHLDQGFFVVLGYFFDSSSYRRFWRLRGRRSRPSSWMQRTLLSTRAFLLEDEWRLWEKKEASEKSPSMSTHSATRFVVCAYLRAHCPLRESKPLAQLSRAFSDRCC
jgi:hypothetical protein